MEKIERADPDLVQALNKRYQLILRSLKDEDLRMVLKYFDNKLGSGSLLYFDNKLGSGSSLSVPRPEIEILPPKPKEHKATHPPIQQKETPPPSRDAYRYLYVQRHERLSRLNLSKLSEAPMFELVCNFGPSHPRDLLSPVVCFNVNSDIYMVGDVFVREKPEPESRYKPPPFFEVLSIDTAKSPSFLPCTDTIAAGFAAPMVRPLVFTLHGKIYVLALLLYTDQPCFQVFDDGKWKTLPPPPFLRHLEDCAYQTLLNIRPIFESLYAWGHKIVVCTKLDISYCFDTKTIEWEDREDVPSLKCVAEYHNFLIAKPLSSQELVVYELDADGYPRFSQNLDELKDVFLDSHISHSTDAFIIPFDDDDDKFCLTFCDMGVDCLLHVAVFRMTISNLDGKKKLTAVLEAHQVYPFYKLANSSFFQHICSAFIKCDNLNLDNLEADQSFGWAFLD